MEHFDVLLVGAGLFNAVLAHQFSMQGKKVLVLERREEIGGNCHTYESHGIDIHKYGAHIFHTSNTAVWDAVKLPRSMLAAYLQDAVGRPRWTTSSVVYGTKSLTRP